MKSETMGERIEPTTQFLGIKDTRVKIYQFQNMGFGDSAFPFNSGEDQIIWLDISRSYNRCEYGWKTNRCATLHECNWSRANTTKEKNEEEAAGEQTYHEKNLAGCTFGDRTWSGIFGRNKFPEGLKTTNVRKIEFCQTVSLRCSI